MNSPHVTVGGHAGDTPNYRGIGGLFRQLFNKRVYQCRIAIQTLGNQGGANSENHLTIYLLLGSDQSVRFDMKPGVNDYNIGELTLTGHKYARSYFAITFRDIDATNCPTDFEPTSSEIDDSDSDESDPRVTDFLDCIVGQGLQYFRFVSIGGHSMGCHDWVMQVAQAFVDSGLLNSSSEYVRGVVMGFSTWQYDMTNPPIRIPYTPGIFNFLSRDDEGYGRFPNRGTLCERLCRANDNALQCYANVCGPRASRTTPLMPLVDSIRDARERSDFGQLRTATMSLSEFGAQNGMDLAIASDISSRYTKAETLKPLVEALGGRDGYAFAIYAIRYIITLKEWNAAQGLNEEQESMDILALSAVIDMARDQDRARR